ncbi:prephenate dehydrogenase [Streptomyces sp. NPDC008092]|uniref:prephenate dehydrogenase n=1 Tax=Streptomyces sp. NPDC008092 TaxID=3364808 RepID=UPI0036E327DC
MRTLAVVGTGLIGTSVALAASRRGVTVFLSDRDPVSARTAAALGAGLAEEPVAPVDLAVLAVPPSAVGTVLAAAQRRSLARVYTDVASVKSVPVRMALRQAPDPSRFVGGHPLAGRERSGPLAARADLFLGRPWALTPAACTSDAALGTARELVELCGAVPVVTRSRDHDDAVALTSHVPHLVASLMAARLREGPDGMSRFAGQGLRDVTRIAHGDSGLWGDILQANAASIAGVVRDLHADLSRLVTALDLLAAPDGSEPERAERARGMRTMVDLLDRGIAGLAQLPATCGDVADARVRVAVGGRPGELRRLLDAAAEFVVAPEETVVVQAADAWGGGADGGLVVRFPLPSDLAECLTAGLRAGGWAAECEQGAERGYSAARTAGSE